MNDENPYEVSQRAIVIKGGPLQTALKVIAIIFMILMGGIGLLMSLCGLIVAIPSPGLGVIVAVVGGALMFGAYAINKWVNRPVNVNEEVSQESTTGQVDGAKPRDERDER